MTSLAATVLQVYTEGPRNRNHCSYIQAGTIINGFLLEMMLLVTKALPLRKYFVAMVFVRLAIHHYDL